MSFFSRHAIGAVNNNYQCLSEDSGDTDVNILTFHTEIPHLSGQK